MDPTAETIKMSGFHGISHYPFSDQFLNNIKLLIRYISFHYIHTDRNKNIRLLCYQNTSHCKLKLANFQ